MKSINVQGKEFEPYITSKEIHSRLKTMAGLLNHDYKDLDPIFLPVLNGAFIFTADLVRYLDVQPMLQFVRLSTYGDEMKSSKTVQSSFGLNQLKLKGRHVLILEDIIDTGFTSRFLMEYVNRQQPASVRIATLLFKPDAFEGDRAPDYVGFHISNEFVVGYGLDYAQYGRELPGIYRLRSMATK
ncbi:MAG: phosphoribosyltransferase family protein [Bacteroidota bacterium]